MQQNSNVRDVETVLNELKLYYEKEKTYNNLKYKGKLRFDFYLPLYNLCIEFNGTQHYEYIEYFHKDESQFDEQRLKDHIKREYCRAHNIHLIELPCSLTSDEIRAELVQKISNLSNDEFDTLQMINEFLNLNEAQLIYMNHLYEEYKKMLKQLNLTLLTNYNEFKKYVINYWHLSNKKLIKNDNGNYYERWTNHQSQLHNNLNDELFNENDTVFQFVNDILEIEEIQNQEILPVSHLYQIYKEYLKDNNPSMKPMSQKKFITKLELHLKSLNYKIDEDRKLPSYFNKRGQYNQSEILQILDMEYLNLKETMSRYFINQNEIDETQKLINKALSSKDNVVLHAKANELKQAISNNEKEEVQRLKNEIKDELNEEE